MILTLQEAILWHRKMWNWIADEIEKIKDVLNIENLKYQFIAKNFTIKTNKIQEEILSCCFLCEYSWQQEIQRYDTDSYGRKCNFCPLEWGDLSNKFMCEDNGKGLYTKCKFSLNWQEQAAIARQIANLQERRINENDYEIAK